MPNRDHFFRRLSVVASAKRHFAAKGSFFCGIVLNVLIVNKFRFHVKGHLPEAVEISPLNEIFKMAAVQQLDIALQTVWILNLSHGWLIYIRSSP